MTKLETMYLLSKQAATYLNLSPKTLEKWRHTGKGPSFVRMGRSVRYAISELEEWAHAQSRKSTSEV